MPIVDLKTLWVTRQAGRTRHANLTWHAIEDIVAAECEDIADQVIGVEELAEELAREAMAVLGSGQVWRGPLNVRLRVGLQDDYEREVQ